VESAERKTPGLGVQYMCAGARGFIGVCGSQTVQQNLRLEPGGLGGYMGVRGGGVQSERSLEPTVKKVNNGKGETAEGEEALQPRKKRAKG
jgi:hypothetical protein